MAQNKQRGVAFVKTTRPVIGSAVRREALFARIDGNPGRQVVWISGPAGSGKSTLVSSYVEARNVACVWYQIDPDDADVATFFHYLSHAARRFEDGRSRDLPAFAPQFADDIASFSRKYFRQLFQRFKTPTVLVLDNLHEVPAASPLHTAIETGLAQVPAQCCVMVLSRLEPPASLARLRAGGAMVHLGWEDLRVSPEEIAQIANLRGQALSPEVVAKLHERTQGWAAGLVLMLEHAKVSGRMAEMPGDATPKVIFDYLAGEIFDRFEPKTQQFLLRIACMPRTSAEIAQALTGEERAGRLLHNLAQNDYFVREVPGNEGRFFQIHPLLREFLRNRAAQLLPEAIAAPALKQAAALLRGAGHLEDAVALLAECREWDEIARIASEEADEMLLQGRSETLAAWLDLLPRRRLEADARLLFAQAASRVHASPRSAHRLYAQAYEIYRSSGNVRGMTQCCSGVIRSIILEFDDLTALDSWSDTLSVLLAGDSSVDPAAAAILIRALLLRDPGNESLPHWLERAERAARASPDAQGASAVLLELALARAMAAILRGDLTTAEATVGALQTRSSEALPDAGVAISIAMAISRLLDGAHDAALRAAREGLAKASAEGLHAHDQWLRVIAAAAALCADDRESAIGELKALESADARTRRGDQAFIHYLRAWLATREEDAAGASRESKMALAVTVELGIPWLECLARIAWAQALSSDGDYRGAEAQVRGAVSIAERLDSPLLRVSAQLAAAGLALRAGNEAAALDPLRAGLALGREHGLRYIVAVRPRMLAELCAAALLTGIEPDYARSLARAGSLVPPPSALRLREWPRPFQITMLGSFALLRDSVPVEFSSKGPGRPMELLKVLVALGGQNVRSDQLADALWPRVDADYAHKSFTATLHRLRRIFDEDEAVILRDARLSLNPRLCWVDAWALEQLIAEMDGALRESPSGSAGPDLHANVEELLALYRGPFLPDESEQPSFMACREQIRARLQRCLARVARRWEDAGTPDAAIDCYQRCIDADAMCEAFHRNLMQCYQRRGEHAEALSTYERLRTLLSARLKTMPSPETQALYANLLAQHAAAPSQANAEKRG